MPKFYLNLGYKLKKKALCYYITIYNKLFYYYFFSFVNFASDFHA